MPVEKQRQSCWNGSIFQYHSVDAAFPITPQSRLFSCFLLAFYFGVYGFSLVRFLSYFYSLLLLLFFFLIGVVVAFSLSCLVLFSFLFSQLLSYFACS